MRKGCGGYTSELAALIPFDMNPPVDVEGHHAAQHAGKDVNDRASSELPISFLHERAEMEKARLLRSKGRPPSISRDGDQSPDTSLSSSEELESQTTYDSSFVSHKDR